MRWAALLLFLGCASSTASPETEKKKERLATDPVPGYWPDPDSPHFANFFKEGRPPGQSSGKIKITNPIREGLIPWWFRLKPGLYELEGGTMILAVGVSAVGRDVAAAARHSRRAAHREIRKFRKELGIRDASASPAVEDLFLAEGKRVYTLLRLDLASRPYAQHLASRKEPTGREIRSGHLFQDNQHRFRKCPKERGLLQAGD